MTQDTLYRSSRLSDDIYRISVHFCDLREKKHKQAKLLAMNIDYEHTDETGTHWMVG